MRQDVWTPDLDLLPALFLPESNAKHILRYRLEHSSSTIMPDTGYPGTPSTGMASDTSQDSGLSGLDGYTVIKGSRLFPLSRTLYNRPFPALVPRTAARRRTRLRASFRTFSISSRLSRRYRIYPRQRSPEAQHPRKDRGVEFHYITRTGIVGGRHHLVACRIIPTTGRLTASSSATPSGKHRSYGCGPQFSVIGRKYHIPGAYILAYLPYMLPRRRRRVQHYPAAFLHHILLS